MDQNVKKNPLFFNVAWNEIIKFLLRLVYFFDGISLSFLMKHFLKGIFPLRNWYNKLNKKSKKHKSSLLS